MNKVFHIIVTILAIILVSFCVYITFVYVPVAMYAESECLSKGYPTSQVTVGLERYCTNFDGSVTVKVEKQ